MPWYYVWNLTTTHLRSHPKHHSHVEPPDSDEATIVGNVRTSVDNVLDAVQEQPSPNRRAYELLGDAFVEMNDLAHACEAYKKAGASEKLRAIGAHDVADKLERRRTRRRPFDADGSARGDAFVASGDYRKAIATYREAGAHERLVALGDTCAADPTRMHYAHAAYVAAGATDSLRRLGRALEEQAEYATALRSFIAAGDRDAAERIGDLLVQTSDQVDVLYAALKAYRFAKARGKLIALGRKFVALGNADQALSAFRSAAQLEQ